MPTPKLDALNAADAQRRLSREALLSPKPITEDIPLMSMDGQIVTIKSMNYDERREIQRLSGFGTSDYDQATFELLCICVSVVDPELTKEDVAELRKANIGVIEELSTHISFINSFGRTVELKKDSAQTENSDSPSSSQNDSE